MKPQKLYAIRNPSTGLIKIGLAISPEQRMADLECGAGVSLELLLVASTKHAATAERYVHSELSQYRIFREWFNVPKQMLEPLFSVASELREIKTVNEAEETISPVWRKVQQAIRDKAKQMPRGWQVKFADRYGIPRQQVNDMVAGRKLITS